MNKSNFKAFYCDIGYYYDTYQKKCIEDLFTKSGWNKEKEAKSFPLWLIIFIVVGMILVLFLILLLKKRRAVKYKEIRDSFEINPETKLTEYNIRFTIK